MKATKLIHPSYARTVLSEKDAALLLQSGWLELDEAHTVSKNAAKQWTFRRRCKEAGLKRFTAYLPLETLELLMDMKNPGETNTDLLERVVKLLRLLHAHGENP